MDYLVYVAHDAENLQFFLWLRDYTARFNSLKKEERALSPEWKPSPDSKPMLHDAGTIAPPLRKMKPTPLVVDTSAAVNKELRNSISLEALTTSPTRSVFDDSGASIKAPSDYESFISKSVMSQRSMAEIVEDANQAAGLKWQSCMFFFRSLGL